MKTAINVEGAIYKSGKWLLITRSEKEKHAAGDLSLPGGTLEEADTPQSSPLEQTLLREIAEETGITIAPDVFYVQSTSFITTDKTFVVDVVYLCEYMGGEAKAKSDEVAMVQWMTLSGVLKNEKARVWTRTALQKAAKLRLLLY